MLSSRQVLVAGGVVAVAVAIGALVQPGAFTYDGGAESGACRPDRKLSLELDRIVPSDLKTPPRTLSAFSDTSFLAVDHAGMVRWVGQDNVTSGLDAAVIYQGVARMGDKVLAYTDRQLFMLSRGSEAWRELAVAQPVSELRSVAGSGDGTNLWIVAGDDDGVSVERLEPDASNESAYALAETWHVPGNRRVIPVGGNEALAISTRLPFDIVRLGPSDDPTAIGALRHSDLYPSWPDSAAPYLAGATSLDCNSVLVTLADLRSRARWILLVDPAKSEITKASAVEATMGFFDARTDTRELFAYRATEGGGEMLVYRWNWVATVGEPGEGEPQSP